MSNIERYARVHPGRVLHSMDHYVLDIRSDDESAAYLSLYSLGFMPEVGTGYVAFLRVRGQSGALDHDVVLADSPDLGHRMQARLRRVITNSDVSVSLGFNLETPPLTAEFHRQPWSDDGPSFRIRAATHTIDARWRNPGDPRWVAAPRGSFHHERDIVGTMIPFLRGELVVNGVSVPGAPYEDRWWRRRLKMPFGSTHVVFGDTAIEPGEAWWNDHQ